MRVKRKNFYLESVCSKISDSTTVPLAQGAPRATDLTPKFGNSNQLFFHESHFPLNQQLECLSHPAISFCCLLGYSRYFRSNFIFSFYVLQLGSTFSKMGRGSGAGLMRAGWFTVLCAFALLTFIEENKRRAPNPKIVSLFTTAVCFLDNLSIKVSTSAFFQESLHFFRNKSPQNS